MTNKDVLSSLETEHQAIIEAELDIECYTPTYGNLRTDYIEKHYVAEFTPLIFQNLRFYKRRKGARTGQPVALYVNPKTGKSMRNPVEAYMRKVDEALANTIIPIRKIDAEVLSHLRSHIKQKLVKNQRETIQRLRKEKSK